MCRLISRVREIAEEAKAEIPSMHAVYRSLKPKPPHSIDIKNPTAEVKRAITALCATAYSLARFDLNPRVEVEVIRQVDKKFLSNFRLAGEDPVVSTNTFSLCR
ncbi:hypothetical protein VKT23_004818 [Stygiomarasmius scandens]|uniref:Uncharacterized protein n=1 Tax=Marasmiellus scandens TaxID=2682957 RepID=A0ABR1JXS3_9AGAR